MRRILIALVMSGAVVVAAPTGALAAHHRSHHSARQHARHHARHHRARHHSRARHERFGRANADQPGNPSGPAGTVTSFDNGVLTITLNDGSMVSGAVTDQTEIECMSANANQQGDDGNDNENDGSNQSGDGDPNGSSGGSGDDNGDNGGSGDDNGDDNGQMCSSASLTPGTPVAEANLELSGSGATWNKVELITS